MSKKDVTRALSNATGLVFAAMLLTGCLSQEKEEETSVNGPANASTNAPPSISGIPQQAVVIGDTYSFTPNASDPDNDPLTFSIQNRPVWANFSANSGQLSGQPTLGDVGVYQNIRISVSDGSSSASLPQFDVSVDQAGTLSTTLSWTAPTQNEDGTALTDLAGYRLYWGTTPGVYTNSVTIDNPGLTSFVVNNLAPGTYEFVATSFNSAGIESVYSNSATKILP